MKTAKPDTIDVLARLRAAVAAAGSQAAFADRVGCRAQFISQMMRGAAPVSDRILLALGLTKEVHIKERP